MVGVHWAAHCTMEWFLNILGSLGYYYAFFQFEFHPLECDYIYHSS